MRRLILLVGPTCSGKSTLEKVLNARGVPSVVSYTTRAQRTGEVDGVHYYFLTRSQVEELEAAGKVAQRVEFAGNLYGSSLDSIDTAFAKSDTAVIVVEPTGVTQFKNFAAKTGAFEVVSVYCDGSLQQLVTRLIQRFAEDSNGNPAYYWERLVNQVDAFHSWPTYTADWNIYFTEIDDSVPGHTVQDAADLIMGTYVR